jgi:hypothetical protein
MQLSAVYCQAMQGKIISASVQCSEYMHLVIGSAVIIDHRTNEGWKFAEDAFASYLCFCHLFTCMEELLQKTRRFTDRPNQTEV